MEKETVIEKSAFTGDEITHIYSDLEFIKETLTVALLDAGDISALLDEAERKTQALMNYVLDAPSKVEVTA